MHRTEGTNYIVSDGKNQFTEGPPATTVPAAWLNSVQEEIANVITGAGLTLKSAETDTAKNQMWQALQSFFTTYDFVVSTQSGFNSIIERVAANQYKIKDEYKSVFIKNVTGGFACQGPLSFLSGGDSYGYIETNNCSTLTFEAGAYLGAGDTAFYLKVNTDDARVTNGNIQGIGSTAASLTRSYLLAANNVTFDNCKTLNRKTNSTFYGFEGSGTAAHNRTSQYTGCSVTGIEGTNGASIWTFNKCDNINNADVNNITNTNGNVSAFINCDKVNNFYVSDIVTTTGLCTLVNNCDHIINGIITDITSGAVLYNYIDCNFISNCHAKNVTISSGSIYGFSACNQISGCKTEDLEAPNNAFGFHTCNQMSSCTVEDLDSTGAIAYGFISCDQISACYAYDIQTTANADAFGFYLCCAITACQANKIDSTGTNPAYGFRECDRISGCIADDIDANSGNARGFYECNQISSCYASDIDSVSGNAFGFESCFYGAAIYTGEALNPNNDWMNTNDAQITNKYSCPAVFT